MANLAKRRVFAADPEQPYAASTMTTRRPPARLGSCAPALLKLGLAIAIAGPASAHASPAVDGVRNLSMANSTRASASGSNAVLINPAAVSLSQQFAIEPMYQLKIQNQTSGIGIVVMDSLNNSRVGLGLGYLFMRGVPEVTFQTSGGVERDLKLVHFGHEAFATVSVAVVKQWLAVALKPKYQYTSLRFRDDEGVAHNANSKLNAFGLDVALAVNLADWARIGVVAYNLTGNHRPAYTEERTLDLAPLDVADGTLDHRFVSRVSDYPLMVSHGLAVFPLRDPKFSINFDGSYDFTSYRLGQSEKRTRLLMGGSAEFVLGPVPLRLGTMWDSRGGGSDDDVVLLSGGVGYIKPAPVGGLGIDVSVGFSQHLTGPRKETVLGLNVGFRLHPDL